MKRQAFQPGEIRDENDNIIRAGAYGKKSVFAEHGNNGILDYIINNFEALKDALAGAYIYVKSKDALPAAGDETKIYVTDDSGLSYRYTGSEYVEVTGPINGLSAYEVAVSNGFAGSQAEWIKSLGSDTISTATVNNDGYLILHMTGGGEITTPIKPIIDCVTYRDSAASSASAAKTSETNAANSATAAASSASAAKTSETNAANSATVAASSASAAKTSETDAANSVTAAASSASAAKTSANNAGTSETNAATSATASKSSEVNAANSESKAASILASLSSVMVYKGQVDTYADLPTTGLTNGDTYKINSDDDAHNVSAGEFVTWDGSTWNNNGGKTIDLTPYAKKTEVANDIVSITSTNDTITAINASGVSYTATINNVANAKKAETDSKGQTIDIASIKELIASSVATAKAEALLAAHPVGSTYWNKTDSTDPGTLFGGTWEALPAGYTLTAQGTATAEDGTTLTFEAGKTYGEFKHQLTVGELPVFTPSFVNGGQAITIYGSNSKADFNLGFANGSSGSWWINTNKSSDYLNQIGSGLYHNNLPSSISGYAWIRIA